MLQITSFGDQYNMFFTAESECTISNEPLSNLVRPVVTICGHLFEHQELIKWLSKRNTCPNCRKEKIKKGLTIEPLLAQNLLSKQQINCWLNYALDKKADRLIDSLIFHNVELPFSEEELLQQIVPTIAVRRWSYLRHIINTQKVPITYVIFTLIMYNESEMACELLKKYGPVLNLSQVQTSNGDSMLHIAIRNNDIVLVVTLLEAGADLSLKNDEGLTPVDLAYRINSSFYHLLAGQYMALRAFLLSSQFSEAKQLMDTTDFSLSLIIELLIDCLENGHFRASAYLLKQDYHFPYDFQCNNFENMRSLGRIVAKYKLGFFIHYFDKNYTVKPDDKNFNCYKRTYATAEDEFYFRYIIKIVESKFSTVGRWKENYEFNLADLIHHAQGKNSALPFFKSGKRTAQILNEMGITITSQTIAEEKVCGVSQRGLRPSCS